MAKGIAVVSGSNDVVFKALETGIITAGSDRTSAVIGVTGSLSVSGSTGLPTLYVDHDSVSIVGALDHTGDLQVTGNVYVSLDVSASQDVKAGRDLIAGRNLDVEGTGNIAQKLTIQTGGLEVDAGETILADKLTVESNGAFITGELSGSADLNIGGNLDLGGTANIGDKVTVESNGIDVTGDSTFQNNVTIKGNLDVEGDINQTNINQSNLVIEDAIILVGSGSDASSGELGLVFGTENSKAFSLKDGNFYLGDTSDDASDGDLNPDNDGLGRLILANLSASATVHALDLRVADSAEVTGTLDVRGDVTLGVNNAQTIVLNGVVTASSNVVLEEDVTMGTDSDDLVKVVGQIRMPIFTVSGDNNVSGYPLIPSDYVSNKAAYNGHMFYLTSSDDTNWTGDDNFLQGNKWYFNERGDWHASFLIESTDYL